MKTKIVNDIVIKLGETDKENWELIDAAQGKYVWVHLKSFPSGHVIIEDENPDKNLLTEAGNFCKEHTKYRKLRHIKVSITLCNNLKKGAKIGEVFFKKNKDVKDLIL